MAKTKKPADNSKERVKLSFFRLLLILAGADLVLLLAPGIGLLNSLFYIPDLYTWPALVLGIGLLVLGFRGLYRRS